MFAHCAGVDDTEGAGARHGREEGPGNGTQRSPTTWTV